MVSVFGWWRALMALIRAKQEAHWIEPGNEITRAILSGHVQEIGPRQVRVTAAAPMAATDAPFVATPAAELPEPVVAEPAAAAIEETPAAAEVPARSRRRRSHRAA
jgi:hypothetical protein